MVDEEESLRSLTEEERRNRESRKMRANGSN